MPRSKFKPIHLTEQQIQSFWQRVAAGGPADCWPWTRWHNKWGYGVFNVWRVGKSGYSTYLAHRIAYAVTIRQPTMCVLHHCDNPTCCNPKHLYEGSDLDNTTDMIRRGRANHAVGSKAGLAKLQETDIPNIRCQHAGGIPIRKIAESFGVTKGAIRHILIGRTWRHIE